MTHHHRTPSTASQRRHRRRQPRPRPHRYHTGRWRSPPGPARPAGRGVRCWWHGGLLGGPRLGAHGDRDRHHDECRGLCRAARATAQRANRVSNGARTASVLSALPIWNMVGGPAPWRRRAVVCAEDETHLHLLPHVRASWTLRGARPKILTPGKNRHVTIL